MKIATMLSAAALVVALGFTPVHAQAPGEAPGGPAAAGPGGPGAGGPGSGPDLGQSGAMQKDGGAPGLTGQKGDRPNLSAQGKGQAEGDMKTGGKAGARAEGEMGADAKAGATAEGDADADAKTGAKAEGDIDSDTKAGARAEGDADGKARRGSRAEGDIDAEGKTGATAEGKKSGRSAKLQSEQVSKVKSYFRDHKPRAKSVSKTEVSVSIGVGIPTGIALYDLPPDVIVVSGACPIRYFVWGDDIVLVDSCSREVVEIIVDVA